MSEERKIVNEMLLPASAEEVWNAVATGEGLETWFPLEARVTPEAGGSVWLSWGEGGWETPITLWEPNKRLSSGEKGPGQIAVDYIIESRGGETVLRIVTSGFGEDTFDYEVDMSHGWDAFLLGLRHYFRHHRGSRRGMAYFRHPVIEISREEGFDAMMRVFGFNGVPKAGDEFDVETKFGERLQGRIESSDRPFTLTASFTSLNRAFLMIEIERGKGRCRPAAWLSLFGDAAAEAERLQERVRAAVTRELGS